MNVKGPIRSAGLCQRFEDFSKIDDLSYMARTTGLKGNELNFTLLKQGTLMNGSELQHSVDRTYDANPQARAHNIDPRTGKITPVPVAYPREKQRDDLELQFASKFRPRP